MIEGRSAEHPRRTRRRRPKQPRTPLQRGFGWLGVLLIVGGAAALAWVAWQMFGTNWVSGREQDKAVDRIEQDIERGRRIDPAGLRPGEGFALLRIPRFGASYRMPILKGVDADDLTRGVGWFSGSAPPGGVGNFALAAHRVTHGEPFRRLPELRPGDTVTVQTPRRIYRYRLDTDPNRLNVRFTEGWVVGPLPRNPDPGGVEPASGERRLITLTTCSELFHTEDRMIAFGHLVSSRPVPSGA